MKHGYNQLKVKALAAFENRGWLRPGEWGVLVGMYSTSDAATYIRRHLYHWRLVDRSLDRRGLLLYRLNCKGVQRLAWLRGHLR